MWGSSMEKGKEWGREGDPDKGRDMCAGQ